MPGSARDEAERLVATMLAMAGSSGTGEQVGAGLSALAATLTDAVDRIAGGGRRAGSGAGGHQPSSGWATGSAECCVCPVCKAIAAVRDPSPATAVRLASGAGDIATGLASLMRGLSSMAGDRPKPKPRPATHRPGNPDETWSAATREPANRPGHAWAAATNPARAAASGAAAEASGVDPWAAASAADAAAAEADLAEARARREAARTARKAAGEAARRVAEAAALAKAAKRDTTVDEGTDASRTPREFDVWAAATADAGVADAAGHTALDHDVPGAEARGNAAPGGDAAPSGDAV